MSSHSLLTFSSSFYFTTSFSHRSNANVCSHSCFVIVYDITIHTLNGDKVGHSISFIHAADLHLDSPFKGLTDIPDTIFTEVRNSTFHALDKLVWTAINKKVDFVLLVGDLFDNERQSLKAQVHLRNAFLKLEKHSIDVYVSYGNHDFINGNMHPMAYPKNVHIFPNENVSAFVFEKDAKKLASIYGFSYENRDVTTNKTSEYQIINEAVPFHIAMLHGSVYGNNEHDTYAPFQLSELQNARFHYWALGHIHKREQLAVSPPVVYSGNTQGRHRKETGEKGCYYVTMSEEETKLEFVALQSIQFEDMTIDISHCKSTIEIEQKLLQMKKQPICPTLYHVTFYSTDQQVIGLENNGMLGDLIEIVNDTFIAEDTWGYIYQYRLQLDDLPVIDYGEFFVGELIEALEQMEMDDVLHDLYTHPKGRHFFEKMSEEEMKERAKHYLLYELLKVEEGG